MGTIAFSKIGKNSVLPEHQPNYPRDLNYLVKHYKLEIWLDIKNKSLEGKATLYLTKNGPIKSKIVDLDAVALNIVKVYDDVGPLRYDYDGKILRVFLRRKLSNRESKFIVEYSVKNPESGLFFVEDPPMVWSQGETEWHRYWMPIYDYPNMKFTSELIIHVHKGFKAFSNGVLLKNYENDVWSVWHYKFEWPHSSYLIALAAGDFNVYDEDVDGIKLEYIVPKGLEQYVKNTFKNTPDMIRFFNDWLGIKYPYNVYRQVVVKRFIVGGMENTSMTILTDRALLDDHALLEDESEGLISHELVHQWFGDLVTCKDWSHIWLNESFATYMANLYYRHWKGDDEFVYHLYLNLQSYLNEYRSWYSRPIVFRMYKYPEELFDAHSYPKGGLILHTLKNLVGDEVFRNSLIDFLESYQFNVADTEDFRKIVEKHYGRSLDWFFEQFVYNAGHPIVKVEYSYDFENKLLNIKLIQSQGEDSPEKYRLPLDIVIEFEEEKELRYSIWFDEREKYLTIPLKEKPRRLYIDPEFKVFMVLETKYPLEDKINILMNSKHPYWRILMAKELSSESSSKAVDALAHAVERDSFYVVSIIAAKSLGEVKTEYAKKRLLYLIDKVNNHKVRKEIVRALGNYKGDDVAKVLIQVLENKNEAYGTRGAAALSLGKIKFKGAYEILINYLDESSHDYKITKGVLSGLAELGNDKSLDIILKYTSPEWQESLRAHAVSLLGKFPEKKLTYQKLMEFVYDKETRFRRGIVAAAKELMDPKVIPVLEKLVSREKWGWIWKSAKLVINQIKENIEKGTEWKKLRESISKIQEEARVLGERVEKLESKG